jgi:electron transport complex protein RnfG
MNKNFISDYKVIFKTIFIICLLGLIFATLLSLTFEKSYPIIEKNRSEYKKNLLGQMLNNIDYDNDLIQTTIPIEPNNLLNIKETSLAYIAKENDIFKAVLIESVAPDGYRGEIQIITAINHNGEILNSRIVDHKETPGLGDYIDQKKSNWIENFNGMNLKLNNDSDWRVVKDQGTFDYKAGATITPRAVIKSVKNTLIFFNANKELFL